MSFEQSKTAKWPDAPIGEVVSMVMGPEGPIMPGTTTAGDVALRRALGGAYLLHREVIARAVSDCMKDAMSGTGRLPADLLAGRISWWGVVYDQVAVQIGRLDDGRFCGCLMSIEEAVAAGMPSPPGAC